MIGRAASLGVGEQMVLPGFGAANGLARKVAAHRLPTNTTTRSHPIHRWFNFIAGFSPEFVATCCIEGKHTSDDLLLDPFAGCATAPLAACQLGMHAIGFEAHPVFARIGRGKLPKNKAAKDLEHIRAAIASGLERPIRVSVLPPAPREFLSKLFSVRNLELLLGAREALRDEGLSKCDLAFLVLSRMVEKCSHSQTDGIYKAPTTRKTASDPSVVLQDIVTMVADDLATSGKPSPGERGRIFGHTSESMSQVPTGAASIIVTSPPYLNNFDYAEMTRMLLYFWGMADSWGEITERVRSRLIVNTTTALKGHKNRQDEYRARITPAVIAELDSAVGELRTRRAERAGKKEYDYLVFPYFAQMTAVLAECLRCLRPGGMIHIMVADAALYGVHISSPQILASIMMALGFHDVSCEQVRRRGERWELAKREGSPKGLGEYHLRARR